MIEIDAGLIRKFVENEKRIDNRSFDEYREITIEPNIIASADGSARVRMGETEVVAGIKMNVGEPFPDTPDEGVMMVASEFLALASPKFESGPPSESSIEVSRVVDRVIRESKAIDFKKLCIKEGEKVWMVYVDIDVMNHDGNLIDASALAAVTALLNTRIPELDENEKPIYEKKGSKKLHLKGKPVSVTMCKINGKILVDPNLAESDALDARLTVGTVDMDDEVKFCALQKGGNGGISIEDVEEMLDIALRKGEELRKMLK